MSTVAKLHGYMMGEVEAFVSKHVNGKETGWKYEVRTQKVSECV